MKFLFLIAFIHLLPQCTGKPLRWDDCHQHTFKEIKREIAGYSDIAKAIINLAVYGITAEVLVVTSFDELQKRAQDAKGKIVVYNQPFISYKETVKYRLLGAAEAGKVGAVASLIRSIASFSVNSPHTGWQQYQSDVPKIPTACISVEDAEMMARMSSRGTKIVVTLKMGAKTYPDTGSFNTVAEIVGSKYPEQVSVKS
uniref:Carboxypeptidase Q n=1 Tax=Gopherus evgoodei TaxID=1825980 RepID=A0A8C4VP58_9SAUR